MRVLELMLIIMHLKIFGFGPQDYYPATHRGRIQLRQIYA